MQQHDKLTRQQDDTESPEHFHPAEDLLSVFGLLEFTQVGEADTHGTSNTVTIYDYKNRDINKTKRYGKSLVR